MFRSFFRFLNFSIFSTGKIVLPSDEQPVLFTIPLQMENLKYFLIAALLGFLVTTIYMGDTEDPCIKDPQRCEVTAHDPGVDPDGNLCPCPTDPTRLCPCDDD